MTAVRDRGQTCTSLFELTQMPLSSSTYAETSSRIQELGDHFDMTHNVKLFWTVVTADNEARKKDWEEWAEVLMPLPPLHFAGMNELDSAALADKFDADTPRIWQLVPTREDADADLNAGEDDDEDERDPVLNIKGALLESQLSISALITEA